MCFAVIQYVCSCVIQCVYSYTVSNAEIDDRAFDRQPVMTGISNSDLTVFDLYSI